jgi:hypothetical protein
VVSRAEQRAVLRRFVPEDRDGFVEMNRDPGVRKYFPGLLTPEESLGEMTCIEQHWDTLGLDHGLSMCEATLPVFWV